MTDFPFVGNVDERGEHPRMADYIRQVKYFCLCRKGKTVELQQPKAISQKRSDKANRYLWGLYGLLSTATGFTKDEWHDSLRGKFLFEIRVLKGEELKVLRSTAGLPSDEFTNYVKNIREWQQKYLPECYLPTPDEWRRWEEDGIQERAAA